jgi:hypothetical protein
MIPFPTSHFRLFAIAVIACCGLLDASGPRSSPHRARSESVPGAYGLLWLEVAPADASISLDGRFVDLGVWLISLAPGSHHLSVRKEGFAPHEARIGIAPGRSLRLNIRLDPR